MPDTIIWAAPDGSWGGCERDELIIVTESKMTEPERDALEAAIADGDENEIFRVIVDIDYRING